RLYVATFSHSQTFSYVPLIAVSMCSSVRKISAGLLDYLVRAGEHRCRQVEAERPDRLHVDHQFDFRRPLDWQVGRLFTFENSASVYSGLAIHVSEAGSVAYQAADLRVATTIINCGNHMARYQTNDLISAAIKERIGGNEQRFGSPLNKHCERRFQVVFRSGIQYDKFFCDRARLGPHLLRVGRSVCAPRLDEHAPDK